MLGQYDRIGLDTETTGLQYPRDKAFCVGIATPDGRNISFDFRSEGTARFQDLIKHYSGRIICHNASFDYRMLLSAGVQIPIQNLDCTAVRATLINEHESTIFPWTRKVGNYQLDTLCQRYIGHKKVDEIYTQLAEIFGGLPTRNVQITNLQRAPWEVVLPYLDGDATLALKLWEWQEDEIERQDIRKIVDFERRLMPIIIKTEVAGIRVNLDRAEQAKEPLTHLLGQKQAELNKIAGRDFNVNSPKQVRELFNPTHRDETWWVGDYPIGTTAKGAPSFGGDYLKEMPDPRAELIGDIRSLLKTRDTFLQRHIIEHSHGDRVYPNINQTKGEDGGTGTGRLSYTDPALQQIPSRNKAVAAIVKPCFLPDEGHVWADSDLASFEVRIFAHLVAAFDGRIAERYANQPDLDFHQMVADMTGLVRNATYNGQPNAKQLNLSMIFCQGNGATAAKMGMPWEWDQFKSGEIDENGDPVMIRYQKAGREAMDVINRYHRELPGVKKLAEKCKEIVGEHSYIKTEYGRKLRFPKQYKDYKSSGLVIQSTSADINKENWMLVDDALDQGRLLLNTHDSYGLSLPEDTWEREYKNVKEAIERDNFRVPILLDFNGVGANWWEALSGDT